MSRSASATTSSRRARLLRAGLAACVAGGTLVVASPSQAVSYDYIDSCTASFSPDRVMGSEVATLSFTYDGGDTVSGATVAADGTVLVPILANVPAANVTGVPYVADVLQSSYFRGNAGLHGFAFFANADYKGAPLCTAMVTVNERTAPVFTTDPSLPAGKAGVPYSATVLAAPGDYPDATCTLEGTLPAGLSVVPPATPTTADGALDCGTIAGTPTIAGMYTLTGSIAYSAPPIAVESLATDTVTQDFTLVIAEADQAPVDTPRYTG